MNGKARTSRWRARQVAEGGKPIGVTLTPGAAQALETLQASLNSSQREVISLALELAAHNPELLHGSAQMDVPTKEPVSSRLFALEQRLRQLEEIVSETPGKNGQDNAARGEAEEKQRLIAFTARQMMEHGERMSRVRLYSLAKEHDVPVPPTQHEYNVFISYHMDMIRDIMRRLKERTH